MSMLMVFSASACLFIVMPLLFHPLSVGFNLLVLSTCVCLVVGSKFPWFGYILFLVFVGGLMVMFGYVCALSSNILIEGVVTKSGGIIMGFLSVMVFAMFFVEGGFIRLNLFVEEVTLGLGGDKLIFPESMSILLGLALILFLTLLAVVKVCVGQSGPLREHFLCFYGVEHIKIFVLSA